MPVSHPRTPPSLDVPSPVLVPLLPTLVSCSFKGGSWKTSIAVACAERLAYAGRHVLLLSADPQRDARQRLGIKGTQSGPIKIDRGSGSITVATATEDLVLDVLYRRGPEAAGLGKIGLIIVDMPPTENGVALPGVFMVVPLVDHNAVVNAVKVLVQSPANSSVLLVRCDASDEVVWNHNAESIEKASRRSVDWVADPVPRAEPVKNAHAEGKSIWLLPRRHNTRKFQDMIDHVSELFWGKFCKDEFPKMPVLQVSDVYIPGWSRE